MGYYTDFELSFTTHNAQLDDSIRSELQGISGYISNCGYLENAKWYNWTKDMKELSLNYPEVLFELEGKGEEQGDHWRAYFKGGKSQVVKAVITFEKYNESKLV